jgi:hypothetical protein
MSLRREHDEQWDRWYIDDTTGEKFAGVTSILNVLNKEGVNKAKLKQQAVYLADNRKRMADLTKAQYLAEVKNDSVYLDDWRVAREIGTQAHTVLEDLIEGIYPGNGYGEVEGWEGQHPELWMTRAWEELNERFNVQPLYSETMVFSEKWGYAGTYDNAWMIDGELCIVDAKTNKNGPRASVGLQNMAYAMAESMYLPDGTVADNVEFERSRVFWVRPEGWQLYELRFDNELWVDFRAMLRAYQHVKLREGRVIEDALVEDGLTYRRWF